MDELLFVYIFCYSHCTYGSFPLFLLQVFRIYLLLLCFNCVVREAKTEVGRGGGRGGGRGYSRGRGGGGFNREASNNENFSRNREFSGGIAAPEDVEGGRPYERRGGYGGPHAFGGGRRGGFSNEEFPEGDRPRRIFERRSGTGRG